MFLSIQEMKKEYINEILMWRYESPYDFYNSEDSEEDIQEFLEGDFYALLNEQNQIFGFYCTGVSAQVPSGNKEDIYLEDYIDMGIGMNPCFVGKGKGMEFCERVLKDIYKRFPNVPIRLTVATFNQRAIRLYKKLGFVERDNFLANSAEFITMVKE
ncbi:GNAT family N-acetyltransferase [Halobacillus mangrovi]|uniref:GNAT family N-acetyltransferase n=1 Tax=Halobacillus mangrovi TaxID=402384 RepID=A0A1W5ZV82_9BACI|nr:GNAT family N-acetyltransferase [Halobacillus mangrovi]ARI77157.1 GNAT family N-acetyltransferase [Halobacillus mangrovi]